MRTRRAKSRTSSRYANVIEHLESRYLLTDLVGDTPATATNLGTLTAAQPIEIFGTIDTAFDLDVFRFQAGTQETATIELSANFSSLDTFVRLLDSSGNELAFNDDSGPGTTNSLLRFTVSGGATFFVEAGDFFDGIGDFFLRISLDAGDTLATATDLGLLSDTQPINVVGAIEPAIAQVSDRDVFQFQTNTSGLTLVELNANFSFLDTVITVFDSFGTVIASNDDVPDFDVLSTDNALTFLIEGGASYFVEARGFSTSIGDYRLSLTLAPDLGLLTLAQPLEVFDVIESEFDRDVFQFQAETTGTILVELSSDFSSLNTFVSVLNSAGVSIASNDDIQLGIITNSRLAFAAQAGETYFAQARGFDNSVGAYRLNLTLLPDVGDTIQTAQSLGIVTAGQPVEMVSVVNQAFDRDVFQFQVAATGTTVVELNRGSGFLDAFVTVLDSSGNVIAFDDDSGPGLNSRLIFAAAAGVNYFVEARGFGSSVGEYLLRITSDAGFPVASATNLGNLTGTLLASGTIEASELHDLFLFTATTNGIVEVRETASASDFFSLDSDLRVFDVDSSFPIVTYLGPLFGTMDPRFVTFSAVAGHSYFAEVTGYFGSVGHYDLSIAMLVDIGDSIGDAENLGHLTADAPLDFSSRIGVAFDRDVFRFQVDASGSTVVELGTNFSFLNTVATVFDSLGNVIATNDDIDVEAFVTDSRLVFTATAGQTYFVEARGISSSTGEYSLRILPPVAPRNVGNLTTTATATRPLMTSGTLAPLEFHDLFVFTAVTTGTVQVSQAATPVDGEAIPLVGVLFAFDTSTGAPLAVNFGSFDTTVPRVTTFSVMAGQSYFAEVTGFADSIGDYQLSFNYVMDDVPQAGVNFVFPSRAGSIEVSGDIDTYRFTADANQTLQISLDAAAGSFLDPVLDVRVFASNDPTTPLRTFRNDDFGFSFNSFLSVPVLQGQVIEVDARGYSSSRGRYDLTIIAANGNVAVTNLVANTPAVGSIETAYSTDVFRFLAESQGVATIDVTSFDSPGLPLGAIGDPIVTIRETVTGNFVAFDDDSGPGLNSLANFSVTAGTQYDVVVGGFSTRTGNYQVTLTTNTGDDGNTFDQATALSFVNNSLTMSRDGIISLPSMNRPADVDVFSFTAGSNGTLLIRATPTSPSLQAGLSVFQASPTGNTADVELLAVAVPPQSGNASVREVFVPVTQGRTYFFRVSGLNGSVGNYSLLVEDQNDPVPGEAPGADLLFVGNTGTPANLSDQSINFQSDRDWYRLIAPAIGEFTINLDRATGSNLDPILTIYNDQGLAIVRNDDSGVSTLNSRLTLQARRANEVFFVEAAGVNETTGDYQLTVQFAAQAADDFGNDVGHSSVIPEGSPGRFVQQGRLEATQDRDFFAFTAAVGGSFTLELVTPNGGALPAGVEVQVFEVEAASLTEISIDNLTQVASITSRGPSVTFPEGELALNLPGDNSTIAIQRSPDDLQRTERHFLVTVSNVGMARNVGYNFSINVTPGVASQNLQLQNAALFALLSLADGAAAMGDQNPVAINAAIQAAMNELGKSGSFLVVLLDPVADPVTTDSAGRQTGFMSNIGTLNGVPGGYASVGSFGQVLIVPVNLSQPGSVSLQFAGVGSLIQATSSFSAFVVGPSGSAPVSQSGASLSDGGKGNFVVQLGFGDTVIPKPSTASGAQSPSFSMMTSLMPNYLQTPSSERQTTEDLRIVRSDDEDSRDPPEPGFLIAVLEGVLHVLHNGIEDSTILRFEDGLRQSMDRHPERISAIDLPVELLKNTSVGRSAKAMYEVLKHSAGWFRNTKPTTPPAPKQRTPVPKVTQETPSPKNASQARLGSKKLTHLGG